MNEREALQTILDQVDYTSGACGLTEMVGAVLPKEVIQQARQALRESKLPNSRWEALKVGGGPRHAENITLRAYGPIAVGKTKLLMDIMDGLKKHPRWKSRVLSLDSEAPNDGQ